jgi:hypothetical protein
VGASLATALGVIRKVAFGKAALAGAVGAAAWELAARASIAVGVPALDVTHTLGTLATRTWLWWPVGMVMHGLVGVIWAIFYAYFFWAIYDRAPWVQGLTFAVVPALLAGVIMVPELGAMHEESVGVFGWRASGIAGPLSVLAGHAIYGVVLGAIYTHPVGQRVRRIAHA